MVEQRYRWKNKQLRKQIEIVDGKRAPSILLKNATYLNHPLKRWVEANIWIYGDRIIYVGDKLPDVTEGCEIVDCTDYFLVPGYIEPHSHPFQLYNPQTYARYSAYGGTTTLVNDNLQFFLHLEQKKAFTLLEELKNIPASMYWWCRFDAQTELRNEETIFTHDQVTAWLEHDAVVQGGELTAWPRLLAGHEDMLNWVQEAKRMRKKIEGHFPGASEKTLAKLMLLGADCDHEAMTGQEVLSRLMQGYTVSLRNSSIRPDLENLLKDIHELGIHQYDNFIFTTDGSHSSFYDEGCIDKMIKIALEQNVPIIDAYNMATINVARYYNLDHLHGKIATGRIAHINFLQSKTNPTPVSVLAKGQWIKRDGVEIKDSTVINWAKNGLGTLQLNWNLTKSDLQFTTTLGLQLVNDVITKPFSVTSEEFDENIPFERDECFFMMIDRNGEWRINTFVKGFANQLCGFASTYSGTGDIILIGKRKEDMLLAFQRMKEIGGGIVIAEHGKIIFEIPLELKGYMSTKELSDLIEEEKQLKKLLQERGYQFGDPAFTLLFFSATHLPYIRITPIGIYDVMKKEVLLSPVTR